MLEHIRRHDDVWLTTGDEIAQYYLDHHYDEAVAHLAEMARYTSGRRHAG